jgi:hypothetical protein
LNCLKKCFVVLILVVCFCERLMALLGGDAVEHR